MSEGWLSKMVAHLNTSKATSAEEWGKRLHEALTIAEVEKYATENSHFMFRFDRATQEEIAAIRAQLTPLENRIVMIVTREEAK